jgi:hypothetical protein
MPVPSLERRTFLERARRKYQEDLTPDGDAGRYLTETRHLSWDSVSYFRLGVVNDPLPGHESYRGMLAIPYIAPNGDTLQIRFRRLFGEGPKFKTMPGDIPRPYNTPDLEKFSNDIWITEGEPDTWILHQLGLPSVAIPGATVWRPEWKYIFAQYRTIYVPCDGDEAGYKFGQMLAEVMSNVRPIDMGKYETLDRTGEDDYTQIENSHDVNSYYIQEGAEATLKKVGAQ